MPRSSSRAATSPRNDVNWLKTSVRWPSARISSSCSNSAVSLLGGDVRVRGIDELGGEAQHPQQRERAEDDEPVAVEVVEEARAPSAARAGAPRRTARGARRRARPAPPAPAWAAGRRPPAPSCGAARAAGSAAAAARAAARDASPPSWFSGTLPCSMGPTYSSRKRRADGKSPGADEREQRPQLGQAVLHRRAGDRERHIRAQVARGAVRLGLAVLDELGLVEHESRPLDARRTPPRRDAGACTR